MKCSEGLGWFDGIFMRGSIDGSHVFWPGDFFLDGLTFFRGVLEGETVFESVTSFLTGSSVF